MLKKIVNKIFDTPFFYAGLRTLFLGGLPTQPILKLLDAQTDDIILDIGCGTGFIAEKIKFKRYYGFDMDPKAIRIANQRKIQNAHFQLGMVQDFDFEQNRPTKAILYGILHHLNDMDVKDLLNKLTQAGVKTVVTLDPVYSDHNFINNILCKYDRGEFVRKESTITQLLESTHLKIKDKIFHYANTRVAKYILFQLSPQD